jgi:hypothetical protein
MSPRELERGDVVQLSPEVANPMFACCFMAVTEPKAWGAQGYVQMTGENGQQGGAAYYRATWEEMEYIGRAEWVIQ